MSDLSPLHSAAHLLSRRPGLLQRLQSHLSGLNRAHADQARLSELPAKAVQDTGLAPETLTGAPSHDPALPFFLQSRFACRDR